MHIGYVNRISDDDLQLQWKKLEKSFPLLNVFPGSDGSLIGAIGTSPQVAVFYNHNIAFAENVLYAEKLQHLGYSVSSIPISQNESCRGNAHLLWEHLQKENSPLIFEYMERLILPVVTSLDINELEFAVYNPTVVTSTDDVIPPYVLYDEIFTLHRPFDFSILVQRLRRAKPNHTIALSSRVENKHIPLVDFSTAHGPKDEYDLRRAITGLRLSEQIPVDSGNSYHHYGQSLLNIEEFHTHLLTLAADERVGQYWPAMQAQQGFALLRIAPSASKPYFPCVLRSF